MKRVQARGSPEQSVPVCVVSKEKLTGVRVSVYCVYVCQRFN